MKKFLALALAIVMMAAIAVPAFAAEYTESVEIEDFTESVLWTETRYGEDNEDAAATDAEGNSIYLKDANDTEEENTRIEYGVAQAYTVTIPADVRLYEYVADDQTNQTKGFVYGQETISVSDVVIAGDEELNIYLSSAQWAHNGVESWTLVDTETGANNVANGDGPSADVNYKIVVADADTVDATNYLTKTEYEDEDTVVVVSSTDRTVVEDEVTAKNGLVLNCATAAGNVSTLGSTNTAQLYFSSQGTAQEGTFRDILTFTVRIQKVLPDAQVNS